LTEQEGRSFGPVKGRQQEFDAEVESLAQRIVAVVNAAEPEYRQPLREYALDLVKSGTEVVEPVDQAPRPGAGGGGHPLGLALLVGGMAVPMLLIFPPVGLTMGIIAGVLGVVGLGSLALRR
jgi:hypothetical protein